MKRNLLLQRDFLIFDPWDACGTPPFERSYTGPYHDGMLFKKHAGVGITLSVYGTIGTSDLTGEKTVLDMEVFCGDGEITNGLPEGFLQELVNECVEAAD